MCGFVGAPCDGRGVEIRTEHCPACDDERTFEQPPCVDGHTDDGGDCPEWLCTGCGTALLTGAFPPAATPAWERRAA
jgi:hypothetical protein